MGSETSFATESLASTSIGLVALLGMGGTAGATLPILLSAVVDDSCALRISPTVGILFPVGSDILMVYN